MINLNLNQDLTVMLVPERLTKMRRILLIENDPEVSSTLVNSFPDDIVERASTIGEGIDKLRECGPAIDAVILDPDLPCCQGLQCYQQLRIAAPKTPIVVMSGSPDTDLAQVTARDGVEYLLRDAAFPSTLQTLLRTSIERFHLVRETRELRAKG